LPLALLACGGSGDSEQSPAEPFCDSTKLDWGWGGEGMLPGTDCLACHKKGGKATAVFTVAGTVMATTTCPTAAEGVTVTVEDSAGSALELLTNEVGNFFSSEPLELPLTVSVEVDGATYPMMSPSPSGSCGFCHSEGSKVGFVPAG